MIRLRYNLIAFLRRSCFCTHSRNSATFASDLCRNMCLRHQQLSPRPTTPKHNARVSANPTQVQARHLHICVHRHAQVRAWRLRRLVMRHLRRNGIDAARSRYRALWLPSIHAQMHACMRNSDEKNKKKRPSAALNHEQHLGPSHNKIKYEILKSTLGMPLTATHVALQRKIPK